jgi:hypothetical protein
MSRLKVVTCTLEDAPTIARNNVSAFWEDKNWALKWTRKNKSLEYVISQAALRWPYNLVKDTIFRRREKVVDVNTGELVGFATWILPKAEVSGDDGDEAGKQAIGDLWPEARVADVDEEALELLKKKYDRADWESDRATDALKPQVNEMSARLKGDKKWLSKNFRWTLFGFLVNV